MKIISIDFETANYSDVSICAVGLALFDSGELLESRHWLVHPPKGHGWFREDFVECHGINWSDVRQAPEFPEIASEVVSRLQCAQIVIAHNAPFDMRKLRGTLDHFQLPAPEFDYLCTLRTARRVWPELPGYGLGMLAAHIGHTFRHHNAKDDAEAAGRVLYAMVASAGVQTPADLLRIPGVSLQRFTQNIEIPPGEH
jgi:DNA polymerase-3 subunit epsilon